MTVYPAVWEVVASLLLLRDSFPPFITQCGHSGEGGGGFLRGLGRMFKSEPSVHLFGGELFVLGCVEAVNWLHRLT